MGVGASNLSSSDLSVYQSSLTNISQNLINSTKNASGINLQSKQTILFKNGGADISALGCDSETRLKATADCRAECTYYKDKGYISSSELLQCQKDCADSTAQLYPACTSDQITALTPTINCPIRIGQTSTSISSLVQVAENEVNASMTTDIANAFESSIDKTINQTNKDLNFMQFNSSNERTSVSQSIRTDILNSITNTANNLSSNFQNNEQTVEFTNNGVINCEGCQRSNSGTSKLLATTDFPKEVNTSGCALHISQENMQKATVDQKASAAMTSTFNNTVANNLASKYKLAVTQKNDGVSLMDLLLPLIIILVLIIAIIGVGGYVMKGFIKPIMNWIGIGLAVLMVIGGIFVLGLALGCELVPTWPSYCPANHKEPSSGETAKV